MAYEQIGWKDYPDKTTPLNAKNLSHMEEGIFDNSVAIGDVNIIASIGDGTCAGAISAQNETFTNQIAECFQSVSDGKSAVATALTKQGVATASDATFATLASNVTTAGTARYNSGYSAGVTAADARVNTSSASYTSGYTSGYNAGVSAGGSGKYTLTSETKTSSSITVSSGSTASITITASRNIVGIRSYSISNRYLKLDAISISGATLTLTLKSIGGGDTGTITVEYWV